MVSDKVSSKNDNGKIIIVLAVLAVLLVALALASVFYSGFIFTGITGQVTGEANLTIASEANINTTSAIEWGEGKVNTDSTQAYLDTSQGTVTNGNWTAVTTGLLIQNNGNVNVSVAVKSGDGNAANFIGGTSPTYRWNASNYEANACDFGAFENDTRFVDVNTTAAGNGEVICSILDYISTADVFELDFNITIPDDASTGIKSDTITFTATAL